MSVQGPNMRKLGQYVGTAEPGNVELHLQEWQVVANEFVQTGTDLDTVAKMFSKAFSHTSLVTENGASALHGSSDDLAKKAGELNSAISGLSVSNARTTTAKTTHARLQAQSPQTLGPAPSTSDPQFNTDVKNMPTDEVARRSNAFNAAQAKHNADVAQIADNEREAYTQITLVDGGNTTAQPPVRKISQDPNKEQSNANGSSAGGGSGDAGMPAAYASPGSYSAVKASQAVIHSTSANTRYADGMGYDIIAHHKDLIAQAHQANLPEWDASQGMWVNSDGSPADPSQYAAIEANGELQGVGGGFPMGAVAFGVGGAAVGGGIAMALKARFGSASAAAVEGAGGMARMAPGQVKSKLFAAGSRSGTAGAAEAEESRATASKAGAGSRTGAGAGKAGARGAGAGGRSGGKKDKKKGSRSQTWLQNTDDDWIDPEDGDGSGPGFGPGRRRDS